MNPPPPMFPASGFTTASARETATAASTAFPPRSMIWAPISLATLSVVTTTACWAVSGASLAENRHVSGKTTADRNWTASVGGAGSAGVQAQERAAQGSRAQDAASCSPHFLEKTDGTRCQRRGSEREGRLVDVEVGFMVHSRPR